MAQVSGEKTFPEISFDQSASEILLEFNFSNESTNAGVRLSNAKGEKITIGFEAQQNRFYIDRSKSGSADFSKEFSGIHYAPRISTARTVKLHVLVDVASVELFADDGTAVITDIFFPGDVLKEMTVFADGGPVNLIKGRVTRLGPPESTR